MVTLLLTNIISVEPEPPSDVKPTNYTYTMIDREKFLKFGLEKRPKQDFSIDKLKPAKYSEEDLKPNIINKPRRR